MSFEVTGGIVPETRRLIGAAAQAFAPRSRPAELLEECARRLALSRRSLQRALQEEGTSFSESLQRSRVDAAHGRYFVGIPDTVVNQMRDTLQSIAFPTIDE